MWDMIWWYYYNKKYDRKSFIITGVSNSIEKSGEYKQIEVYKWIKEKYIVTEDEKLIDKEEYIEFKDLLIFNMKYYIRV